MIEQRSVLGELAWESDGEAVSGMEDARKAGDEREQEEAEDEFAHFLARFTKVV